MRVWVTRTEPGASRLTTLLRGRGFDVFATPVLRIELLSSPAPSGHFDFGVFVSEHAVYGAVRNRGLGNAWRNLPAAAIGNAAYDALRNHGTEPVLAPQANAAALVEALSCIPSQTLIVKGEGGRQLLQRWLRNRGGKVVEWNVYRRAALAPNVRGQRFGAIVAASGGGVRAIASCWPKAGDDAIPLLVPSQRVAEEARQLGFRNVVVTLGASDLAVAKALAQLAPQNARSAAGDLDQGLRA